MLGVLFVITVTCIQNFLAQHSMNLPGPDTVSAIGFLSIVEIGDRGFCGGYLLLDAAGRPREFHCTTPLIPTRTQEILYGPTLRRCVFSQMIARPLVERAKQSVGLVLVDSADSLGIRAGLPCPVALVVASPHGAPTDPVDDGQPAADDNANTLAGLGLSPADGLASGALRVVRIQQRVVALPADSDEAAVRRILDEYTASLPLDEPFERIRHAIQHAHVAAVGTAGRVEAHAA